MAAQEEASLKVSPHVVVQLGSELVTDAEQAVLECVNNAYDADSPDCRIEIDTRETGVRVHKGLLNKLRDYDESTDTVSVTIVGAAGAALALNAAPDTLVERRMTYTGRITIADRGDGMDPSQLTNSWLLISASAKRSVEGPKKKTQRLRTPLGDKGLAFATF